LFRSFVYAVLQNPRLQLAEAADVIFQEIDQTVQQFIIRSLQLNKASLRQERKWRLFQAKFG